MYTDTLSYFIETEQFPFIVEGSDTGEQFIVHSRYEIEPLFNCLLNEPFLIDGHYLCSMFNLVDYFDDTESTLFGVTANNYNTWQGRTKDGKCGCDFVKVILVSGCKCGGI